MLLALSVPMVVAATTSQVLIMVVSFSSMLVFAKARTVDWRLVLLIEPPTNIGAVLAAGVLIGSQIGPRFSVKTDQPRLKKYFAVLLLAIAMWMVYGVLR